MIIRESLRFERRLPAAIPLPKVRDADGLRHLCTTGHKKSAVARPMRRLDCFRRAALGDKCRVQAVVRVGRTRYGITKKPIFRLNLSGGAAFPPTHVLIRRNIYTFPCALAATG
jgi:hypothetical protein